MTPIPETNGLGLPVGPWLLLGLKVFGFWLHMVFMNLWLVGIPVGLFLWKYRTPVAKRLFKLMPFFMAFGINAGIVPLLFLQTLFAREYYTATILQGWFWFMVIPLLCVAYYAVYLMSSGYYRILGGLVAFVLLAWIGLNFSSAMTLASDAGHWKTAFEKTATGGAVTGTYLYLSQPVLYRYVMVIGLALMTVASFFALDARFLAESSSYPNNASDLVVVLVIPGFLIFAVAGYLYQPYVTSAIPLFWRVIAGVIPGFALVGGLFYGVFSTRFWSGTLAVFQLGGLLANAVTRQIGQVVHSGGLRNLMDLPVRNEWGPVILFFVTLLIGLGTIVWIARLVVSRAYEA